MEDTKDMGVLIGRGGIYGQVTMIKTWLTLEDFWGSEGGGDKCDCCHGDTPTKPDQLSCVLMKE